MSFCARLKARREELKLTRTALARAVGVVPSAIANYENGVSHPKTDVLYRLFEALDIDPNYLYKDVAEKVNSSGVPILTKHEIDVINAYKAQPEMQPAVDKLLGVEPEHMEEESREDKP